jgi:hypothetical protein
MQPPSPSPSPSATATPTADPVLFRGSVAELVPHAVGDRLVYRVTGPGISPATETLEVVGTASGGVFRVDLRRDAVHEEQEFRDDGDELRHVAVTNLVRRARSACSPELLQLRLPLVAGEALTTASTCEVRSLKGVYLGRFTQTTTAVPIGVLASLAVPSGTYGPVIQIHGTGTVDNESSDYYLAPGVGIIRRVTTSNSGTRLRELIDGTVGGVSVRR